jgi:hypothetical protein
VKINVSSSNFIVATCYHLEMTVMPAIELAILKPMNTKPI